MKFFGKFDKKTKTVVFEKTENQNGFTLRNQEKMLEEFSEEEIEQYLGNMFISPEQFVVLTAPAAQNKVRYVQACMQKESVEVELGIEENGTHLYYKLCSPDECIRVFIDFYHNSFVPKMKEYKPVPF